MIAPKVLERRRRRRCSRWCPRVADRPWYHGYTGRGSCGGCGWLATTALGALAGGAAGSIIGALIESGVPEEDAHVYAEGLRRGGVLLTVRTDLAAAAEVENILDQYAVNTRDRGEAYRKTGWKNFDAASKPYTADHPVRRGSAFLLED